MPPGTGRNAPFDGPLRVSLLHRDSARSYPIVINLPPA
jgi:hypothetical protein